MRFLFKKCVFCSRNAFFCSRKTGPKHCKFAVKSEVRQPRRRRIPTFFNQNAKFGASDPPTGCEKVSLEQNLFKKSVVLEQNLFKKTAP